MSHAKIVRDFHAVIKDFQKAQRVCIEREGMYSPADAAAARRPSSSTVASTADSDTAPLLASSAARVPSASAANTASASSSSYYAAQHGDDPGFHTSLLKVRACACVLRERWKRCAGARCWDVFGVEA